MKKITTFLGCVGVVCLFSGCTSDNLETIVAPAEPVASLSSSAPAKLSSSATATTSSTSQDPAQVLPGSSSSASRDTTVVHNEVVVIQDADLGNIPTPNYSSGVFCWSKECETKYAGQVANPETHSSSSMTIDIGMSVEAQEPPVVTETQMIDSRDQSGYDLIRIGGVHWMASNLKYRSSKGSFCDADGKDVCATYGVFYSYAAAKNACPPGWRLPTQSEVEAADAVQPHEWWTVGGRFKLTTDGAVEQYGLADEQGYIWIVQSGEYTSWRVKNYSGDSEHTFQTSEGARAYNVRCVEGE